MECGVDGGRIQKRQGQVKQMEERETR